MVSDSFALKAFPDTDVVTKYLCDGEAVLYKALCGIQRVRQLLVDQNFTEAVRTAESIGYSALALAIRIHYVDAKNSI